MQLQAIFFLFLALILSFSIAYFQYYFKEKYRHQYTPLLLILRMLSLFLLFLLCINPSITSEIYKNEKPILSLVSDNSSSIGFFNETKNVKEFQFTLNKNSSINKKFNLQNFKFGNDLQPNDRLTFKDTETNIFEAISKTTKLNKDKIAPIILATDGNQTVGPDYEFLNSKQPIYPVIFGDTTRYEDLKISQVNSNKYSFLGNQFPIEVMLNYEGKNKVSSVFKITTNGKTVFTKNLSFSPQKKAITISTSMESVSKGVHYFSASIEKISSEKNTKNNTKDFFVEVIDEQTNVLILTSLLHPDVGALKKAIESNKQRKATICLIDDFKNQLIEYQLIVLYQPNGNFNKVISKIKTDSLPFLFVSGATTDWNFVNAQQLGFQKKAINKTENYGATFNNSFVTLLQENIGFENFPPLKDGFGEVIFNAKTETLLYQNVNGIERKIPLMAIVQPENQKCATLFGEGIWKWRAASFLKSNSFEDFDEFIGNLVSFLASNKKRNRLEVRAENLIPANATVQISAFYLDETYKFDPRASLELTITNQKTKKSINFPFSLQTNSYQVAIENLLSGVYEYKVVVLGQNLSKSGKIVISDYQIEAQFSRANVEKLENLAQNSGGKVFYQNQFEALKKELMSNETFYTIQKSIKKEQQLIDWKWVLFAIVSLLTAEWFLRKYIGKV